MDRFSVIVRRKDMLSQACLCCKLGWYELAWLSEDRLECTWCDHRITRWLTKKECLAYYAQYQRELNAD